MNKIKFYTLFLATCLAAQANAVVKTRIYTPNAPMSFGSNSQGIEFGDTVYISLQLPVNPYTNQINPNFSKQVEQVLSNVSEITHAAGGDLDNLLKITIYLTNIKNLLIVDGVVKQSLNPPYPARTVIEVKKLPRNADIAIEAVMGKS